MEISIVSANQQNLPRLIWNGFVTSEGTWRIAELILSIFEMIKLTSIAIPTYVNNSFVYLGNFTLAYKIGSLYSSALGWFSKNKHGERIWETERWQSLLQLVFITALAILEIPKLIKIFSASPLKPPPIALESCIYIFGIWNGFLKLSRLERKAEKIQLLKNVWKSLQEEDLQKFDDNLARIKLSTEKVESQYPQDKRDQAAIEGEIEELCTLRDKHKEDSVKVHCSIKVKKWEEISLCMKRAQKKTWIINAMNISCFIIVWLNYASTSINSNTVRVTTSILKFATVLNGLRYYYLNTAYKDFGILDLEVEKQPKN